MIGLLAIVVIFICSILLGSPFTGREAVDSGAGVGVLKVGATTVTNVQNVSIDRSIALHDSTTSTMTERTWNKGLGTAGGSFTAFHDDAIAPLAEGTTGNLTFVAYSSKTYTIAIIIESYSVTWTIDGLAEVAYNFRMTGVGAAADYAAFA